MRQKLFRFLKRIYQRLPGGYRFKGRMKGLFYRLFGFLFKNSTSYRVWKAANTKMVSKEEVTAGEEATKYEYHGRIAVHLHLFYQDLREEFFRYFSNIPYGFDLFVTVPVGVDVEELKQFFEKLPKASMVKIIAVENRGRDVAPFVVTVGPELGMYDVICHLHSKKSLYTGGEQSLWRQYLLDGLMGNESVVRQHFYMMEHGENVGLVYPETYRDISYLGHTWMSNRSSRQELLDRINVPVKLDDTFVDFPLGTMFWAKREALQQFFCSGLKNSDFPKEGGQNDGTIAHAFERCIGVVSSYNGFHSLIYQGNRDYIYDFGKKCLFQYYSRAVETTIRELMQYDVITFDVFDTLISRNIWNHRDISRLTERYIDCKYGIKSDFFELRMRAEKELRDYHPELDCNVDDIYAHMKKISSLSGDVLEDAKNYGIELNNRVLSRKEVNLSIYQQLVDAGKEVYLISDMHLKKNQIVALLEANGIQGYKELLLSSDLNLRKDNGTMWTYFINRMSGKRFIHVGDNEVADAQIPIDMGGAAFPLLNGRDYFEISSLRQVRNAGKNGNLSDRIMLGLLTKQLFDDPFRWNLSYGEVKIDNSEELGYCLLGPLLTAFSLGLRQYATQLHADQILFCAREGSVLKTVYETMFQNLKDTPKSSYLYVSRRAVLLPNIVDRTALEESLEIHFVGSFRELMSGRYGIMDVSDESEVILPDNKQKVLLLMQPYEEQIYRMAHKEAENYRAYFNELVSGQHNLVLCDIGYSGTIQYYLSKLTNEPFHGYYLATDSVERPLAIPGNTMEGYYANRESEPELADSAVLRYQMILECLMTCKDAQLAFLDENANPVFVEERNKGFTPMLSACQEGAIRFVADYREVMGELVAEYLPETDLAEQMLTAFVRKHLEDESLRELFEIDDPFCKGVMKNALSFYRENNR